MATEDKISVLFVCLGNICRSPMAGAVFAHLVKRRGLDERFDRIESAGTANYHIGEEPDERTVATCKKHGVPVDSLAQQALAHHFDEFDYILAMDVNNLRNLERIRPKGSKARLQLFGEYGDGRPLSDPYYGKAGGFDECYAQCTSYSEGLLASLGLGDAPKRSAKA